MCHHHVMRRPTLPALILALLATAAPASAQEAIECGEYRGVVCEGYFTDEPNVATDHQSIEDDVARVGAENDVEFALVVVQNSRGDDPADFAVGIGEAWRVGDPEKENGLVVLVSIDERRLEVAQNDNVDVSGEVLSAAARPFFQAERWEAGLLAVIVAVDQSLQGDLPETGGDFPARFSGVPWGSIFIAAVAGFGGFYVFQARRKDRKGKED